MTGFLAPSTASAGLELARRLARLGAETVVAAPKDALPFDEDGPAVHGEEWRRLGRELEKHLEGGQAGSTGADQALREQLGELGGAAPEYWLVMLCAASERYPETAVALGLLMDQTSAHLPTPICVAQLLHAALGLNMDRTLCRLLRGGQPARLGLIEPAEVPAGKPTSHQSFRLAAEELAGWLGQITESDVVDRTTETRPKPSLAFDDDLVAMAAYGLEHEGVIGLRGSSPRSLRQFAVDLATRVERQPLLIPVGDAPAGAAALLRQPGTLPILEAHSDHDGLPAAWLSLLRLTRPPQRIVLLLGDGVDYPEWPIFNVHRLGWREAERIWHQQTQNAALAHELASRFRVTAAEAAHAWRHASGLSTSPIHPIPSEPGDDELGKRIAAQLLELGAQRMGRMVTRLQTEARLDQLVVPPDLEAQLREIVDWQRHSPRVFDEMGVGRYSQLGRGLTCLFCGSPGTGKTFAAQCVAQEMGLNLYRIDLSQIVSKYIGETEKALAAVFDEAEAGHGVLLFDEADALFGTRSEVKDAHDRYANIEVSYLLQRIEIYEGVAILSTNMRDNMDPAFLRRIRFILQFSLPDAAMSSRLWEQSLPGPSFRSADLDLRPFVEQFTLSGGVIQNIALAAAHMAAAEPEGRIGMDHLVLATRRELEKQGRSHDWESVLSKAATTRRVVTAP